MVENMLVKIRFILPRVSILIVFLTVAACASTQPKADEPIPKVMEPYFPPHEVMQSEFYSAFLVENQEALLRCTDESLCAIYLFNLGFIYSYPKSPYFNQAKGTYYFDTLMNNYPNSSFSSLAKIWSELVKRCITAENTKHQLRGRLKSKEVTIKELQKKVEEKTEQVEEKTELMEKKTEEVEKKVEEAQRAKDVDAEIDRVEKEVRRKLEQSRAIDVEIERKERELPR
jgi:hypothetical protein